MTKQRMPFHELADIFPLMGPIELAALVADIEAHGLREPIVKYKGKIVDGRNRYNACLKARVEPYFVEWDEQGELVDFIVSVNLHRRHLDESQRATVAAKLANLGHGQKKSDTQICGTGISQTDAAELVNVSPRLVSSASKVLESAPADVVKAMEAGEVKASDAANIADLPKHEQSAALKAVESESSATLTEAAVLAKLDTAVVSAFKAKEFTLATAKKLAAMDKLDQLGELKKIRAAAERKAKANAPSTQVVAGHKSNSGPKPPANDKKTGPWAPYHKILGKLVRTIDECANAASIPTSGPRIKAVHAAFNEAHKLVLALERGK